MQEWRATLHVQIRQLMNELANASVEEFDRVDTALRQVLPLYCACFINPQIRLPLLSTSVSTVPAISEESARRAVRGGGVGDPRRVRGCAAQPHQNAQCGTPRNCRYVSPGVPGSDDASGVSVY